MGRDQQIDPFVPVRCCDVHRSDPEGIDKMREFIVCFSPFARANHNDTTYEKGWENLFDRNVEVQG